jgi:Phosphodiester glycosidase
VPHTTWHKHTLAPGVVMTSGVATDSKGTVNMHVLRVDLTRKSVSVRPLMHAIAERTPLSTLAQGHKDLVAATNTGFFDFRTGAPTLPLISQRTPLVMSSAHQPVVGVNQAGRVQAANVWWSATLTDAGHTDKLVSLNEVDPPQGISVVTARWGQAPVRGRWGTLVRPVVKGLIGAAVSSRFGVTVPSGGKLLVATGSAASKALGALPNGSKVSIVGAVKTSAASPFVQAYGVGVQLVATAGVAKTGFTCNSANTTQPARTAIGFANGGRTLIIGVVAEHPFTTEHGLDNDQMSALMTQLGVSAAYEFDGSGSTELLAKVKGSSSLALQNYPADGAERVMPLGLGIFAVPAKPKHAKHKHKR